MARRSRIAEAYVQVVPSFSGFGNSLTQQITGEVNKSSVGIGRSVGGGLARAIGGGFRAAIRTAGIATAIAGTIATGLGSVAAAGGIGRALNIEDAQAKLKGLGYDLGQVQSVTQSTLDAVLGTIYSLDDGITVAASGLAAGIQGGEQLTAYLKTVADTASITGGSLTDIGLIFNSIQAQGKVFTSDLNQLAQRGLPVFQYLAEELGVTGAELSKMVSEGKVSSEVFLSAINNNISGAALAGAETTRGAFANMVTAINRFGAGVSTGGLPIAREAFLSITSVIDTLAKRLNENMPEAWARASAYILPKIDEIQQKFIDFINFDFDFSRTPFGPFIDGIHAVGDAIGIPTRSLEAFGNHFQSIGEKIYADFKPALDLISKSGPAILSSLSVATIIITNFGDRISEIAGTTLYNVLNLLVAIAKGITPLVSMALPLLSTVIELGNALLNGFVLPLATALLGFEPLVTVVGLGLLSIAGYLKLASFANWSVATISSIAGVVKSVALATKAVALWTAGVAKSIAIQVASLASLVKTLVLVGATYIKLGAQAAFAFSANLAKSIATQIVSLASLAKTLAFVAGQYVLLAVRGIATTTVAFVANSAAVLASTGRLIANTAAVIASRVAQSAMAIATGIVTAAQWAWNVALTANPIGIIIVAVGALIGLIIWLATQTTFFQDAWAAATSFIADSIENIGAFFGWLGSIATTTFQRIGDFFVGIFRGVGNFFIGIINNVIGGINFIIGLINGLRIPVPEWMQGIIGAKTLGFNIPRISEIPALWTGANVAGTPQGTVVRIGDRNKPETVSDLGLTNRMFTAVIRRLDNDERRTGVDEQPIIFSPTINQLPGESTDELTRKVMRQLAKTQRRKAR